MIPQNIQKGISMRKNNMINPKKVERMRNTKKSYFDKEEERNGNTWLSTKSPGDMARDAKFIIRDLAKGNVDIEKHAHYFNDNIIINVLKNESGRQLTKYQYIVQAMEYHITNMNLQNIIPQYDYMCTFQEQKVLLSLYESFDICFSNILTTQESYLQLCKLMESIRNNSMRHNIEDITY